MIKKEKEKRKLEVEKGNLGWGKKSGNRHNKYNMLVAKREDPEG